MLHVETARSELRDAALDILLQDVPAADRPAHIAETLGAAAVGDVSLDGLLVAHQDGVPAGAVLFLLQPDGCGFVWPPVVATHVEAQAAEQVADALLMAVCRNLDDREAWLGQALLEPHNGRDAPRLQRNGFDYLTDLAYLRCPVSHERHSPQAEVSLNVDSLNPERDAVRLAAIIERTYDGSADCPQLNGLRSGQEAVSSHCLTGVPLPDGWMVFRDSTGDVGVLALADQPEQDACELVYMGVVPEARGRGFGRQIVATALRTAAAQGRRELLLAVDERNRFAGRIYESAGFEPFDRKSVFVRAPHGGRLESFTRSARKRP